MRLTTTMEISDSYGDREVEVVGRVRWSPGRAEVDSVVVESIDGARGWSEWVRTLAAAALVTESERYERDTEAA